jgi:ribosomal protein S7
MIIMKAAFSSCRLNKKDLSMKITLMKGVFPEVKPLQSKSVFYSKRFIKFRLICTSTYRNLESQVIKSKVGSLTSLSDNSTHKPVKHPFILESCNESIHSLSNQGNGSQELGFAQTKLNGKHSLCSRREGKQVKEKFSNKSQKDSLTSTINHRFIALMLRCGKKSVSYSVFLNALSECKHLLDVSIKSAGRGTIKTLDSGKNNNTQNVSSNLNKRVRNFPMPVGVVTLENNRTSVSSLCNFVGIDRGTFNRFRDNLLVFVSNSQGVYGTSRPPKADKIKVESLSHNCVDLNTFAHSNLRDQTQGTTQQFRVNRRLFSRRLGFTATKNIEIKGSTTNAFGPAEDGFVLSFASVSSVPELCTCKACNLNYVQAKSKTLFCSKLEGDGVVYHSMGTMSAHQMLINAVQKDHEQKGSNIPLSPKHVRPRSSSARLLLKQKDSNAKINRGTYQPERTRIGIDSVNKVSPSVETRKVRIGGATYAVPYVPHNRRQEGVGVRWLISCAFNFKRHRSKYPSSLSLAYQLVDSFKNEGESTQKRESSHQLAAANRAYTRYRWW